MNDFKEIIILFYGIKSNFFIPGKYLRFRDDRMDIGEGQADRASKYLG